MGSKDKGGREVRKPKKDAKVKAAKPMTSMAPPQVPQVAAKDRPVK